jgi:hypothetical protein
MGCKLLLEVSGGLDDRERVLKKMTKTVGQGRIRQDRAQCNMRAVSNLSDKALAYDLQPGTEMAHGYPSINNIFTAETQRTQSLLFAFVKNLLCVLCASVVSLLLGGYWMGDIAIDARRELPEETVWTP